MNEYCIYLPTRKYVDTYEHLTFFGRDVEGKDICCVGVAAVIVGIVESVEVTDA